MAGQMMLLCHLPQRGDKASEIMKALWAAAAATAEAATIGGGRTDSSIVS